MEAFDELKIKHAFTETSEFEVIFPKHRINYIKSVEKYMKKAVEAKKLKFSIDFEKNSMCVKTTENTRDPYIIIKANEFTQLVSKGMTVEDCVSVLEDDVYSEIIYMNVLTKDSDVFENRRHRLMNEKVLKALGILTKTKITVCSKVTCVVGDHDGIDVVRNVVLKCFKNNIHPAYEIKNLMIKNNLIKDNVEGDWDRFLPKIKKGKEIRRKAKKINF